MVCPTTFVFAQSVLQIVVAHVEMKSVANVEQSTSLRYKAAYVLWQIRLARHGLPYVLVWVLFYRARLTKSWLWKPMVL